MFVNTAATIGPLGAIDDSDVVAKQRRPVAGLVRDARAKADALRQARLVELLAKNAQHLLCRRLARELTALQLLEQTRDLARRRAAEPLRRVGHERDVPAARRRCRSGSHV